MRLIRGNEASINCSAIGSPDLRVYWMNDDEMDSGSSSALMTINSNYETFTKKNFTCIAVNEFGRDHQSVFVQVIGAIDLDS